MAQDDSSNPALQATERTALLQRGRVFQVIALVKPFRAQAVLAALESIEVLGGTVREAMGYGRQKDRLHQYLGSEYNSSFLPKVELAFFVREEDVPAAVKAIVGQARTGRIGDGKILVLPCFGEYLSW
jgi:nitrogen regulatory protein P-II 1